jgi:branched-chain amino acid transport system permease protein
MLGAVIAVFMTVMLSDFTKAWQLYLGVFFIIIVMYAPGGVASLLMMNVRMMKFGKFGRIWPKLAAISAATLVIVAGGVMMTEMLYHLTLDAANGTVMQRFGIGIDTAAAPAWLIALALVVAGIVAFRMALPGFRQVWGDANGEIEEAIRRAEA